MLSSGCSNTVVMFCSLEITCFWGTSWSAYGNRNPIGKILWSFGMIKEEKSHVSCLFWTCMCFYPCQRKISIIILISNISQKISSTHKRIYIIIYGLGPNNLIFGKVWGLWSYSLNFHLFFYLLNKQNLNFNTIYIVLCIVHGCMHWVLEYIRYKSHLLLKLLGELLLVYYLFRLQVCIFIDSLDICEL